MALLARSIGHPVSLAGAAITTASAIGFVALVAAVLLGLFDHPYAGLVVFIVLPAFFLLGLLLIPLGVWLRGRALRRDPSDAGDWPVLDLRSERVRRTTLAIVALTAVNVAVVLVASYGALRWMESPAFCGQTCHTPMHPQFTAWQNGAHAEVACVSCHIGEGSRAFVHYKLAGIRQLVHVMTNTYPRPIPAAQADMRPAIETCGRCHTATLDHGVRTKFIRSYADDEGNSETVTELQLHVGGPGQPTPSGRAIHWHAGSSVRIEYIATGADRQTIPLVRVHDARGGVKEYVAADAVPEALAAGSTRVMDCIDCHNAAVHRIEPTVETAVDRAIASGRVDRTLPFVRREGIRLVRASYPDEDAAMAAIESGLRALYADRAGTDDDAALRTAVAGLQRVYRTNVFPAMQVTWGVYADNLGHVTSTGCFRCHDDSHTATDGTSISGDCSYCHEMK